MGWWPNLWWRAEWRRFARGDSGAFDGAIAGKPAPTGDHGMRIWHVLL
ncbi:hypothetical protein EMIT0162MI3_11775 [Pseudomonas chlororaphis]